MGFRVRVSTHHLRFVFWVMPGKFTFSKAHDFGDVLIFPCWNTLQVGRLCLR
jgi:hypothetical protein